MPRLTTLILLLIVAAAAAAVSARGDALATATNDSNSIAVCCAWNDQLADGELTYKISGGDDAVKAVVRTAIEEWEVVGITLTEITGRTKPNINIKFKRGGGQIQGLALRKFDGAGFIKSVDLSISGQASGDPNNADIVGRIAKHEFAHALGTGHANFSGDLLSTTVSAGSSDISACDIETVQAANDWYFGGAPGPVAPSVGHVHCGPVVEPPPPGETQTILVQSIDCGVSGNRLLYTITVVADDEGGDPVEGATVSGTRVDPRGTTFIFEGATNSNGQITFRAGRPARGDHLVTVLDIVADGFEFDAALGESSKTCTV